MICPVFRRGYYGCAALLAAIVVFCAATPVPAQLAVTPAIIEMRSYAGGLSTFTVAFSNDGDFSLDCVVSVSAMDVQEGGLPLAVEDAERSCRDWIVLEPQRFSLMPGEGQKIVCRIRAPRDAGGGYYALIMCTGVPQDSGASDQARGDGVQAGVFFSHRVMSVLMLTVPAPQIAPRIEAGAPMIAKPRQGPGFNVSVPVRNTGNIHTRLEGDVEVRSAAGQTVERFSLQAGRGFVLPMRERLFSHRCQANLTDGVYALRIRLSPIGPGQPMEAAFPFYVRRDEIAVAEPDKATEEELLKSSAGFVVRPAQMGIRAPAGGRRMAAVELANLTAEPIALRAVPLEWTRDPSGVDTVTEEPPPHSRSGIALIEMRDTRVSLPPLARRRFPFFVRMPREATGERYAALCFENASPDSVADDASRLRRSVLIGLAVRDAGEPAAEITALNVETRPNGALRFELRLRNVGDVAFDPDVTFRLLDANNQAVGKARPLAAPPFVQAGGESVVTADWLRVLDPGTYVLTVTLRVGPDKPPYSARTTFQAPALQPHEAALGADAAQPPSPNGEST